MQALQGVENAFARGIEGILSGQMTLGEGLKSIWQGIVQTIIQQLAQLVARWIVTSIAGKLFADESADSARETAVAAQESAASKIWEAHASIPYVGPALAAGFTAMMIADLAANAASAQGIVAHAKGGVIDRPTLALMGEVPGSREIVAPETTFRSWADNLTANILASERQVRGYRSMGQGYSKGAAQARSAMPQVVHNYAGATIVATNSRQWEDMVAKGKRGYEQRFA